MPQLQADPDNALSDGFIPPTALPARRGTALLSGQSGQHRAFRLDTLEPPTAILLKELLGPAVAMTMLALCALADRQPLSTAFFGLEAVVWLVSDRIMSVPALRMLTSGRQDLRPTCARLLLEWCAVAATSAVLVRVLQLSRVISSHTLLTWFFVTPAALLVSNVAALYGLRRRAQAPAHRLRCIIVGVTEVGIELARRVGDSTGQSSFVGFFDFRSRTRLPALASEQWIGTCGQQADGSEVAAYVQQHAIDAIYIALPISTTPRITELLRQLRDTTASVYFVPDLTAFDLVQPRCLEIQGIPALAVCETPFLGRSALYKRAADLALATLALLLGGPLMLAIALAIRLSTRGPVLFRQRRYGLNGESIEVFKFRTMTCCEDGSVVSQATRDDPRVTPIGRWLRRLSLDELPQILNVLQGTMSFVGPRPHAIAHNEMYRKLISGYMLRHKIRPGITGWAQVHGLRGETDTVEKMRARIAYDIDYLKHWSLWLDLTILLRTCVLLIRGARAY